MLATIQTFSPPPPFSFSSSLSSVFSFFFFISLPLYLLSLSLTLHPFLSVFLFLLFFSVFLILHFLFAPLPFLAPFLLLFFFFLLLSFIHFLPFLTFYNCFDHLLAMPCAYLSPNHGILTLVVHVQIKQILQRTGRVRSQVSMKPTAKALITKPCIHHSSTGEKVGKAF